MATEQREHWESLVGRLILICGDIELRLLQLHWNLSLGGSHTPSLKDKGMGEKAKIILSALNQKTLETKLKKKVKRVLNDTIKLAHIRNLVAHNPLYMDVYSDSDSNFVLIPSIRSLRDSNKHISLAKLAKVVTAAKNLEADLMAAVMEVGMAACSPA